MGSEEAPRRARGGLLDSSLVLEPTDDEAVPHTRDRAPSCLVRGQCLNTPHRYQCIRVGMINNH